MPARRKEAVSVFQILPFHGKSSKSGQDLGTRVRLSETKQDWGGRDTKAELGGKG